jgi:hypothetical protein
MITNAREYRITRAAARRFEDALAEVEQRSADRNPLLQKAMRESIESELGVLREQLAEYEALQDGQVQILEVDSLAGLPDALIRARVAAGLTQKALAERLGLKEQQIQRYEASHYAGVAFRRLTEVADALGVQVRERVELPSVTRLGQPEDGLLATKEPSE